MFEYGLLDEEKTEDLIKLLSNPVMAKKLLGEMKAETKKLTELRKEIAKGKTMSARCKEMEAKIESMQKAIDSEYDELDKEKRELEEYADAIRDNYAAVANRLKDKEGQLEAKIAENKRANDNMTKAILDANAAKKKAEEEHKAAEKVKKEYEAKVEDIKKRLKGL